MDGEATGELETTTTAEVDGVAAGELTAGAVETTTTAVVDGVAAGEVL